MKRNVVITLTMCLIAFFCTEESKAQIEIVNLTPCEYKVKVNTVPVGPCNFTGACPLVFVPGSTTMVLPPPAAGVWVPGFGVEWAGNPLPKIVVGTPPCHPVFMTTTLGPCDPDLRFSPNRLEILP